jgi:hypothetical protein
MGGGRYAGLMIHTMCAGRVLRSEQLFTCVRIARGRWNRVEFSRNPIFSHVGVMSVWQEINEDTKR